MEKLSNLLGRWESLLVVILAAVLVINTNLSPFYLNLNNQINVFQLSIEKIIVALVMTLIIINAEIDLSVASVMALAACVVATLHEHGVPLPLGIAVALATGLICGAFNGFWIAYVGLPSLAVTLAGLIGYRGVALILLEDRSIGEFPDWFDRLGQQSFVGPFSFALLLFFVLLVLTIIVLQYSAFGRYIYVIGNSRDVARYAGVEVKRVKMILFAASGLIAAFAGILLAARLGAVRGSTAEGFELDIVTMVLLGGVSIFGGSGTLTGVFLSILIILNLRNGMSLVNIPGATQTGVIGLLLILSVFVPSWLARLRTRLQRRRPVAA
ncbi:MAG: ABC transporter permease [Caldilineaceae bacterium]